MNRNRITWKYVLIYTLFFLALSAAVFFPFAAAGKSLIGNGDGQSQYILQLNYMGRWLRSAAAGLLHGDFHPARYDFTIGMGDDINAVIRFHPLDFLSVFVPEKGTELLYHVLIFLRMYLAGLTFSLYAFSWRQYARSAGSSWPVLAGSMTYLFCGYTFCLGIVHPTYLSPLVTLPLLFLGAERMLHRAGEHRFVLFSLITALSFISNYYFMFIASVAVFLYVLVRFFQIYRTDRVRAFCVTFVRFVLAYALGVLLSAVTLLPALTRYAQSYRSERIANTGSLLLYADKRRYAAWLLNLISPLRASGNGTHLNYMVLVFPALVLLFVCRKREDAAKERSQERTFLRIASIVLLGFLLIPAGGYLMAALSTENNRWVFLIALLCAGAVSFSFDDLLRAVAGDRRCRTAILLSCLFFDAATAAAVVLMGFDPFIIAGALQLSASCALILLSGTIRAKAASSHGTRRYGTALMVGIMTVSTVLNGYMTFGSRFGNLPRYYMPRGTSLSWYRDSVYASYPKADPEAFGRSDGTFAGNTEDNAALLLGYSGVQMYNSVLNAAQIESLLGTENTGLTTMLHVTGLNGRPAAEALAGVRWYLADEKNESSVPFTFREAGKGNREGFTLYENTQTAGLTYGTARAMTRSEFEKLTGVEKEWALMDVSVLEDADSAGYDGSCITADEWSKESGILTQSCPLPEGAGKIAAEETPEGTVYRAGSRKARLEVPFERKEGYVCYVTFTGLKPSAAAKMKVDADGISERVTLLTASETYTLRRTDYTVCLGSGRGGEDTLSIGFTKKGTYALDGISFSYVPEEGFAEKIAALKQCGAGDMHFAEDTLSGTVVRETPGVQVFSIPYSTGWKAEVNGQKADLMKTDVWALGLILPEGASEVTLTYETPGRRLGGILSASGLLLLLAAALILRRRRR